MAELVRKYYLCQGIGDGKTQETAFRPYLAGVDVEGWSALQSNDKNHFLVLVLADETTHQRIEDDSSGKIQPLGEKGKIPPARIKAMAKGKVDWDFNPNSLRIRGK